MSRQTCFVVMPFGAKSTGVASGKGPLTVDFDALWSGAIEPALTTLGYDPIRADLDAGSLIIHEMIQRLAYADLVVAEASIPNGNVYYELGIRHAAREHGCVLISSDWADPLFDIRQMRRVVYPLGDGKVGAAAAATARDALVAGIPGLAGGRSPFFEIVDHQPVDPTGALDVDAFRASVREVNDAVAEMRGIRLMDEAAAAAATQALRARLDAAGTVQDGLRLELLKLLRDAVGWQAVVEYVDGLPAELQALAWVREQRLLAEGKSGDPMKAAGALEQLVDELGETSERCGLVGGRYKTLWRQTLDSDPRAASKHLGSAIEWYRRGMQADLNDYFPSRNLPQLLRARGRGGDDDEARSISAQVVRAVERAIERDIADEWARPTLLGAAFDAVDAYKAEELADRVEDEGHAGWKLSTTLQDLKDRAGLVEAGETRDRLEAVVVRLEALLP